MPPKKPEKPKGQTTLAGFFVKKPAPKAAAAASPSASQTPEVTVVPSVKATPAAPTPAPTKTKEQREREVSKDEPEAKRRKVAAPAAAIPVTPKPTEKPKRSPKKPSPKAKATSPKKATPEKKPARTAKPSPKQAKKPAADMTEEEIKTAERRRFFASRGTYDNSALDKGTKPTPSGHEECLAGLTFLVTGRLDAFDRPDVEAIIKKHGGATRTGVTKRLSYLVVGAEPGESKIKKATECGTTKLSEDELLHLVVDRSVAKGVDPWKHLGSTVDREKWGAAQFAAVPGENEIMDLDDDDDDDDVQITEPKATTVFQTVRELVSGKAQAAPAAAPAPPAAAAQPAPQPALSVPSDETLWADKYAPKKVSEIIGHNAKANEIRDWLRAWKSNANLYKADPKMKTEWRAGILISGPPGIGKTTTSTLVAKECGYDVVEMNASDNRTQKSLKQTITSTLGSRSVLSMMKKGQQKEKDIVIIMDEVGGLDRGGTTEIIAMLKQARTPLICLCNDKYHQKLKSLSNHLMDMPFSRPQKQSVATNLRKKLRECEGVDIHEQALIHVVEAAGNDLRATLNNLQMWARTSNQLTYDMVIAAQGTASKDTDMSPFAAAQQLFFSNLTIPKMESLYYGNDLLGLFVQENYVHSGGHMGEHRIETLAQVSRSLSIGDTMDTMVRRENKWSLGPSVAFNTAIYPARAMGRCKMQSYLPPGARQHLPAFPGYLGKLSTANKNVRLSVELSREVNGKEKGMQGSRFSVVGEYLPVLRRRVESALQAADPVGAADILAGYGLCRPDWDFAIDSDTFKKLRHSSVHPTIETKVKSAMTRALNKVTDTAQAKMRRGSVAAPTTEVQRDEDDDDSVEDTQADTQTSTKASAKPSKKASAKASAKPAKKAAARKRASEAKESAPKRRKKED